MPLAIAILQKTVEGTIYAEVLNFMDALGMSFFVSLIFLFFTTTLPNIEKINK